MTDRIDLSTPRAPFWLPRMVPTEGIPHVSEVTGRLYGSSDLGILDIPKEAPTWPSPLI